MNARPRRDAGVGLVSSAVALLVFVLFLAGAAHLLVAMYATSTVMAVSSDAAREVAARDVTDARVAAATRAAEADARRRLGGIADRLRYDWEVTARTVRLRVVLDQPWRLGPGWNPVTAFAHTDRTIVIRRELAR